MSLVTISQLFRKDVDTRFGIKPKVGIKTLEHGDKWLSSFKTKGTEHWAEGMQVEVNVSEKGDFMNFDPILGATVASPASPALEARVKKLEDAVFGGQVTPQPKEKETEETTLEDEFDTGF